MPLFPVFEDTVNFQTINKKNTSEYQTYFPKNNFLIFNCYSKLLAKILTTVYLCFLKLTWKVGLCAINTHLSCLFILRNSESVSLFLAHHHESCFKFVLTKWLLLTIWAEFCSDKAVISVYLMKVELSFFLSALTSVFLVIQNCVDTHI